MSTFIKVVEVWVPDVSGQGLVLSEAIHDASVSAFENARKRVFAYGEGLPGKAWEAASPLVIDNLSESDFVRKIAAEKVGLKAAIALPIFSGEFLLSVLVFLCGDDEQQPGAIELWSNTKQNPKELVLCKGYFGHSGELAQASSKMTFQKGEGLPGAVWDYQLPMIVTDMVNSPFFRRGSYALKDGINTAFAFPFSHLTGTGAVVAMLSGAKSPIARRIEVWVPVRDHSHLTLQAAVCEKDEQYFERAKQRTIVRGDGLIGKSWRDGRPRVSTKLPEDKLVADDADAGLTKGFTIPITENGILRSMVAVLF